MAYNQNFQGRRCNNPCLFFQNQNSESNIEETNCQSTSSARNTMAENEEYASNRDNSCERICLDQCRCRYEQRVHCCEQEFQRRLACLQHNFECCLERAKCEFEQCKTCCKCQRNNCCCECQRCRRFRSGFFFL